MPQAIEDEARLHEPLGRESEKAIDDLFSEDAPEADPPAEPKEPEPPKETKDPEPPEPPKATKGPEPEPELEPEGDDLFFDEPKKTREPDPEIDKMVPKERDPDVLIEAVKREAFAARENKRKAEALEKEIKESDAKYADMESRLAKLDLSQTDVFRKKYDAPIIDAETRAASTLSRSDEFQSPEEARAFIRKLSSLPDGEAQTLLEDRVGSLSTSELGQILARLEDAREGMSKRNEALDKWKETRGKIKTEVEAERDREARERLTQSLQAGVDLAASSGNPVWGAAKGENRVTLIEEVAEALRESDPAKTASLVAQGVTVPRLVRALDKTRGEVKALRDEMSRSSGDGSAGTRNPSGGPRGGGEPRESPDSGKGAQDSLDELFPPQTGIPEPVFLR